MIDRIWRFAEQIHTGVFLMTLPHDSLAIEVADFLQSPAGHTVLLAAILVMVVLTYRKSDAPKRVRRPRRKASA